MHVSFYRPSVRYLKSLQDIIKVSSCGTCGTEARLSSLETDLKEMLGIGF